MNILMRSAILLIFLLSFESCSSVGKNTRIKEFYCNGKAESPHRLAYVKGVKSTLISPNDNIYDPLTVKYKKFVFEDSQFRLVGESALGAVTVGFRQKECDNGAANSSPYVCTFTIGKLKRFGCGVSFPGTLVPLHVFEPRYRALVKESVKLGRPIGVAHTKRVVSQAQHSGTMGDKLNKNQDSYEPYEIFSAGPCEITEVTGDGRLLAEIRMNKRYKLGKILQEVPYQIYECEEYLDLPEEHNKLRSVELKNKIDKFLIKSAGGEGGPLKELLESESWRALPLSNYGFSVFQILKFEPETMQAILELKTAGGRLEMAMREIGLSFDGGTH